MEINPFNVYRTHLLTVKQVAAVLGTSRQYVYDRIADRELPTVQLGTESRSMLKVRSTDLDKFLEERSQT